MPRIGGTMDWRDRVSLPSSLVGSLTRSRFNVLYRRLRPRYATARHQSIDRQALTPEGMAREPIENISRQSA